MLELWIFRSLFVDAGLQSFEAISTATVDFVKPCFLMVGLSTMRIRQDNPFSNPDHASHPKYERFSYWLRTGGAMISFGVCSRGN